MNNPLKTTGPENTVMRNTSISLLVKSLFLSTAISLSAAQAGFAQTVIECTSADCLETVSTSVVETKAPSSGSLGFSISVDGEHVAGDDNGDENQSVTDLDKVDIQVKFDGFDVNPILNVSTINPSHAYQAGEEVRFLATSNYPAWITSAEVIIYERGKEHTRNPLAVTPVGIDGIAHWTIPAEKDGQYVYVLRVYDARGRFDETLPLGLTRSASRFAKHASAGGENAVSPGNGEDRTAFRNIPVYGGAVTVYGSNVPPGYNVEALNEQIPVDRENAFVVQRILPPGDHTVNINVGANKEGGIAFARDINIPANDWFYVALADLTLGKRFGNGKVIAADPSQFDKVYTKGRLAFYLKGKIQGRYILTAAADSGEGKISDLFRGIDPKDPRQLLRRIDPDDYYPIYGDDSTSLEDAPTNGRFYIKLERGDSHVMWGNYKTTINSGEFVRSERALYGASAVSRSEQTTTHGERVFEASAYAAQPGTLPQRDVYRGTGGSAYFLSHQDITRASETVTIETRDMVSGIVKSRETLRFGEDYDIDYVQGVIILKQVLNATASGGDLIGDGSTGEYGLFLVTQYEYTPANTDLSGYSYGGRVQAWVNDNVRVGASAISEETGTADQRLYGADVLIRLGNNSFLKGEIAASDGPGFGQANSINGGLTINNTTTTGTANKSARAYHLQAQIDLEDFGSEYKGLLGAYFDKKEAGFSSLDYNIAIEQVVWGLSADVEINDRLRYRLNYEDYWDGDAKTRKEINAEVEQKLNALWTLTYGVKYTDLVTPAGPPSQNGIRKDAGVKLTFTPDDDLKLYGFAHKTLYREGAISRNDRYGFGGEIKLSQKVSLSAEVSNGTSGWGGLAALNYNPTADDKYYIGYRLDPDRASFGSTALIGSDLGGIVVGARRKYSDTLSAYIENNYDMYGARRSLTNTYGVIYTPSALWNYSAGVEYGDVTDPLGANLEKTALSASIAYNDNDKTSWKIKGEARFEDSSDPAKDRTTWLASAGMVIKSSDDWRVLANVDAVISQTDQTNILDGDYIEASLGYAYRPVDNDRFNMLAKYTYLYDLPGPDQVTTAGTTLGPAQRSHIFTADASYEINQYLTLGAKYGFRIGEVSSTRAASDFTKSSAHLAIARADFHVVKNWDVLVEGRMLDTPQAQTTDYGVLAAVYRQVNDNFKVGIGYNFGRFSDDLSDLTYDDGGIFLNMVGKF